MRDILGRDILDRLENRTNQTWINVRLEAAREIRSLREQVAFSHINAAALNRRAEVEQYLFDCANAKRPLPTAEECRALALKLGVPAEWHERFTSATSGLPAQPKEN